MPSPLRILILILGLLTLAAVVQGQVVLVQNGVAQAAILTRPNAPAYVQKAATDLQHHLQLMSGALISISTVGNEAAFPGMRFIYVGTSTATTGAGINVSALPLEHYVIRTLNNHLYIVGRDGGDDDWADLSDCQPGTLLGTSHLLGDVLGVRWLWPGDLGTFVPAQATITVPALNISTGPAMVQRKYRTPRIGLYLGGAATYGFGVPVLPASTARRQELAMEELLWLRHMRMGTRKSPQFAHSFTQWWSLYGATHPEYFAELLPGRSHPHPSAEHIKTHVNSAAVWQQRIDDWVAAGAGNSVNICPNDSRSHCVCAACMSWDRPSQSAETVFSSSDALLGDRYARFYTEIANRVKAINPNALVYGYAYDVYQNAPLEATVPDNVALAYIPGAPSDTVPDQITATENDVLGWIAHGCQHMYLRPNWMLSAHAGPFWPTHRVGEHFKRLTTGGRFEGFDSDSSCSSYSCLGFYYYLICRLLADSTLPVDTIVNEYCSGFGSAAGPVRDYLTYWENFAYNQADAGNTEFLGWASGMPAYANTYRDRAFQGALQILDRAEAALQPQETAARSRLDFLRTACIHGKLTAQAIALVSASTPLSSNPEAERAMRALLAYRDRQAESFAVWREWMIDRESFVPGMEAYWSSIMATPDTGYGSNVDAFVETGGAVVMEAEDFSAAQPGTGTLAGVNWEETTTSAFANSVGACMQALPNAGAALPNNTSGPRLDYKIDFHTPGTYYILLRMPQLPGSDNSLNVGLDGVLVADRLENNAGGFRWLVNGSAGRVTFNIATPGVRTLNVWMREDGVAFDRVILTTDINYTLTTSDAGPVASGHRGTTEHLLTVNQGTGDGYYGESSMVAVTANAAPAGWVFDRWTGDTAALANVSAASTYFTMPASDGEITALYKLDPSVDADNDGMTDAWEVSSFGHLSADASTDSDRDGQSDRAEYLAGTNAADASSCLQIKAVTRAANGQTTLQWPSAAGRSYTIETTDDLAAANWTPIAINIAATPPLNAYALSIPATRGFIRVVLE